MCRKADKNTVNVQEYRAEQFVSIKTSHDLRSCTPVFVNGESAHR